MRRLWLDGILQKEVPLSCETVERGSITKERPFGGFHLATTLWNHPSEAIGLT